MKFLKIILFTFLILSGFTFDLKAEENINFENYAKNYGKDYEMGKEERYKLLDEGKLFTWKENDLTGEEGKYIPLKDIKDYEGNKIDIKKFFNVYEIDFNGDGTGELLTVPSMMAIAGEGEEYSGEWFGDAYNYRATVLEKTVSGSYKPCKVADIEGDYSYIIDVRDYNGDGFTDLILGCSAGASSYNDITEVFYFDKSQKILQSQVFSQWIKLYDFNVDGIYELVVAFPEGTNSAHAYWASWDDIYEWTGEKYVMENKKYVEYYDNVYIPQLVEGMINTAEWKWAVTDRVKLIEKAWKLVIDKGYYRTVGEINAREENDKGLLDIEKGDLKNALFHFQRAVELFAKNPEYVNNLGYVYELKGDYNKAIEWYHKTLAREPARAVAWYNLGCCKGLLGEKEVAVNCFYNYIRFAPDIESAEEAIKDLSENHSSEIVKKAAKEAYEGFEGLSVMQ